MTEYNQYFQSSDYQHSRPPKPKFPWFRIIIIALIAGIIGALIVLGVNRLMNGDDSNSGGSQVQQATNDKGGNVLDGKSDKYKSVNAMIKDVSPAIVGVINMQRQQVLTIYYKVNQLKHKKLVSVLVLFIKLTTILHISSLIIMLLMVHHKLKYNYIMVNK